METEGEIIGYSQLEIYEHIKDNFLRSIDKDQEILKTRQLLKAPYDSNHIIQGYYKVISNALTLLTVLGETVSDKKAKHNAYMQH